MKRIGLLLLVIVSALGIGAGQASATPICVGGGVDPAYVTVCTP